MLGAHQDCEELEILKDAVTRMIHASVPYVAKHNAFLIPAENWSELAGLVNPHVAALSELLKKVEEGQILTEEEIKKALS